MHLLPLLAMLAPAGPPLAQTVAILSSAAAMLGTELDSHALGAVTQ